MLIGLDYLHRHCRIIHTDLKPENVIVSLTKEELQEIDDRGTISNMNRNVRSQDVERLFGGGRHAREKTGTILSGVDTEGMTKAQKKKLKAKLKKQMGGTAQGKEREIKVVDEDFSDQDDSMSKVVAPNDQEIEEPEKPRSHSLPNLGSNI